MANEALVPTVVDEDPTALTIVRLAQQGLTPEHINQYLDAIQRKRNQDADLALNAAYPDLVADMPTIPERGRSSVGTYALLEDIIEYSRPVLKKHRFAMYHRVESLPDGRIRVTGTLAHANGGKITSEFVAPADTSGSKNATQAVGSIITYGRRYTANSLLFLASRGEDSDGRYDKKPATDVPVVPTGYNEWLDDLNASADLGLAKLEEVWAESKGIFKVYISKHERAVWEAIKARAAKVQL